MSNLIIKLDALNKDFDRLKLIFRVPKLYISNYFTDLRTEIDLIYATKQDESNWSDLIRRVDTYERDCFKRLKKFSTALSEQTNELIISTENKLTCFNTTKIDINFKTISAEKLIDELTYLISDHLFKLEQIVFLNRKMFLLNLSQTNKLVLITNEYIGRIGTDLIKNSMISSQKLTNEILKSNEFKEIIKKKSFLQNSQTFETQLYVDNITHVELPKQGFKCIDSNCFNDFISLKEINLQFNKLALIGSLVFHDLIHLTRINLRGNKLAALSHDCFQGLINLEEINLSRNDLKALDQNLFSGLISLNLLDLSNNKLEIIDSNQFKGLYNMRCIKLNGNQLSSIDHNTLLLDLVNLAYLDLSSNQFKRRNQFTFINRTLFDRIHINW